MAGPNAASNAAVGALLFAGLAAATLTWQAATPARPPAACSRSVSHVTFTSDALATLPSAESGVKRNESEFSLGLNRSASVEAILTLTEMGELCQTGQIALLGVQYAALASLSVAALSYMPNVFSFDWNVFYLGKAM